MTTYLNAYLVNRGYGGPEEGGWWYDVGEPLESRVMPDPDDLGSTDELYEQTQAEMEARWAHLNSKYPLYSVLCDGVVRVYQEDHFARAFPSATPHFE